MTDTYPPLDGVPFKDGRYWFSDGSSIAPALMRDGMWITHPFGRVFLRRELPIGAKIHYDAPADALVALRAEGYALPAAQPATDGAALIAAERERQIKKEGWTPEHDDGHGDFQLSVAARCYLIAARRQAKSLPKSFDQPPIWPWSWHRWKPSHDPIRNLVKAGALIAAEIDRLLRAKDATEAAKPDHFPDASKMVAPSVSPSVSPSVASQQPEPVKPKMPQALRAIYAEIRDDCSKPHDQAFLDWCEATYDVSEPPALPPKPAALELFEIVNGNHRDWANAEDSRWFIFARADGTRQLIDKSDGWRRMEVRG